MNEVLVILTIQHSYVKKTPDYLVTSFIVAPHAIRRISRLVHSKLRIPTRSSAKTLTQALNFTVSGTLGVVHTGRPHPLPLVRFCPHFAQPLPTPALADVRSWPRKPGP